MGITGRDRETARDTGNPMVVIKQTHHSCMDTKDAPMPRRKCLKVATCMLLLHYKEEYIWVLF